MHVSAESKNISNILFYISIVKKNISQIQKLCRITVKKKHLIICCLWAIDKDFIKISSKSFCKFLLVTS